MPDIDIGDAAMAGFRLLGRHPLAALIWFVLVAAFGALLAFLFGGAIIGAIATLTAPGVAANPPLQLILALVGSTFGFIALAALGGQLIELAIRAAVLRAELEPGHRMFAYLRFGGQELWLIATSLVFWFLLLAANFAMSIPLAIVSMAGAAGTVLSAANGATPNLGGVAGMVGLRSVGQLVIFLVSAWLWVRLSFGVVLTFRERQFRLFEGWSASRGHTLKMFVTLTLVVLMMILLMLVLGIVVVLVAGGVIAATTGGNWQALIQRPPAQIAAALWPAGFALLVVVAINVAVGNALVWGAVARMWRQLHPDADAAGAFT